MPDSQDILIVGASFSGLACASAAASRGLRVTVIERKRNLGSKLHTTGIIVKDVLDSVALMDSVPSKLVRRIDAVRLYAPNLRCIDLESPGYFFLATDTPELMMWLAQGAANHGASIECGETFTSALRTMGGFECGKHGHSRYLVGADGPSSSVAKALDLGRVTSTLFGVENEYDGMVINQPDRLHCFIDRRLAPGYIGWVLQGVHGVQAGIARHVRASTRDVLPAMDAFLKKTNHLFGLSAKRPSSVRAGHIPCGGIVSPPATDRAILIGDAAGMVSPVTAGGIHTALYHGQAAGHAIVDFLQGAKGDPSTWITLTYPRYRLKRVLRTLFNIVPSDTMFNLLLSSAPVRNAAQVVYFHSRR